MRAIQKNAGRTPLCLRKLKIAFDWPETENLKSLQRRLIGGCRSFLLRVGVKLTDFFA
jgi:hypothetical protein